MYCMATPARGLALRGAAKKAARLKESGNPDAFSCAMDLSAAGGAALVVVRAAQTGLAHVRAASAQTFLSLGSTFSLVSLASALLVATLATAVARLRRRGRLRWRVLAKALRPRPAVLGRSGKADVGLFLMNTFSTGGLIGWALLSQLSIETWTANRLALALGPSHALGGDRRGLGAATATLVMLLAYELGYWIDHWLSHNIAPLWEIHKVHHTAEALSPLTNFRVHPLETLKFYNIVMLTTGLAAGGLDWVFGPRHGRLMVFDADVAGLGFMLTIAHLQHSHVWISFRGALGRVLMSPAHHQIHHSTDPRHFGRNLGSGLAVFDWLFGTLYVPAAEREALSFGVAGETHDVHSITGSLLTPMAKAVRAIGRPLSLRSGART
jgi:sterol desaturase/sphingolipid hydroxylase (fatty acid hydroxylase superfamily)